MAGTKKQGRPQEKATDKLDVGQVAKLAARGFTDAEIADFFHISERTITRYKHDPDFLSALKSGKEVADEKVKRALFTRALGYEFEEKTFRNGKLRETKTKHIAGDTTAQIFWLCNRDPENWKSVNRHELTGPNGKPLQLQVYLPEKEKA